MLAANTKSAPSIIDLTLNMIFCLSRSHANRTDDFDELAGSASDSVARESPGGAGQNSFPTTCVNVSGGVSLYVGFAGAVDRQLWARRRSACWIPHENAL
jgi:hypothetical protein